MHSSATTPAATPDPHRSEARLARIAVCSCGKPLGLNPEGRWRLSHRGRAWVLKDGVEIADAMDAVECEVCGLVPAASLDVHEYVANRVA